MIIIQQPAQILYIPNQAAIFNTGPIPINPLRTYNLPSILHLINHTNNLQWSSNISNNIVRIFKMTQALILYSLRSNTQSARGRHLIEKYMERVSSRSNGREFRVKNFIQPRYDFLFVNFSGGFFCICFKALFLVELS